jgi:hypothetical protein
MKKYYGQQKSERYPSGHPRAGEFKPKNAIATPRGVGQRRASPAASRRSGPQRPGEKSRGTLPPSFLPAVSLDRLERELPGGEMEKLNRKLYKKRIYDDLFESLTGEIKRPDGRLIIDSEQQKWWKKNGLSTKESKKICESVADHVANIAATQQRSRPGYLKRIKQYSVVFSGFNFPLEAIVDHESKVIMLNRDLFASRNRRKTELSDLLSTTTHEYAHVVDHGITDSPQEAAFTELFKPLHQHLSKMDKKNGHTPKWMIDSGLAYPLNGYYGMTGNQSIFRQLSKEYVSTLSEHYWHSPDYLDQMDQALEKEGYDGPRLRSLMERVWGNVIITKPAANQKPRLKELDTTPLSIERDLGIRNAGYKNEWQPGKSSKNATKYLLAAQEG